MTRVRSGRRATAAAAALLALGSGLTACSDDGGPADSGGDSGTDEPTSQEADGPTDDPTDGPPDADRDGKASTEPTSPRSPASDLPSAPPLTDRFVPPRDAEELATRLVAAEDVVRDGDARADVLQAAAFEAQLLYRRLARAPGWQRTVLASLGRYRQAAELHIRARRALRSVLGSGDLTDELPAWRIRDPAPAAELMRYYREAQRVHGVPWEVLAAINFVETGFGKIDGLSSAGAQGPMQFIPETWAAYGEGDVNDPRDAILGAANYLAANGGASGDLDRALYAYNNHQGYVEGIKAYVEILRADPDAFRSLYRWEILYLSTIGDVWLPVGYHEKAPVPVRQYVARHPERLLGTATD